MNKIGKLKQRLATKPTDFTGDELVRVLAACEFLELPTGQTGGRRRKFYNAATEELIELHRPHPPARSQTLSNTASR